ncbi:MAG TPA: DUF4148 domain-containing protein [Burkholderiaceae bacterium]|nr:DUF4148 domain-containing protein [Burkholderiaceae bacterium]
MNKLLASALVATATLVSFGAQAQEATEIPEFNLPSTQTRAQVAAELRRAQANGEMQAFQEGYIQPAESARTRAQVVAELRRAQANGEFAMLNAEVVDQVAYETLVAKNRAAEEATRLATRPAPAAR